MSINLFSLNAYPFQFKFLTKEDNKDMNRFKEAWKNDGFNESDGNNHPVYGNLQKVQGHRNFREAAARLTRAKENTLYRTFTPINLDRFKDTNLDTYLNLLLKRIGHVFGLKGVVPLPNQKNLNLEGFCEAYTISMLASSFESFSLESQMSFNADKLQWLIKQFTQTIYGEIVTMEDIEKMVRMLKNPDFKGPLCIGSGYDWHLNMTIFFGNFVMRCERANKDKSGIYIYELRDKECITIADLKKIIKRQEETGLSTFKLSDIKDQWKGNLIYYHQMKKQKGGYCTYTNAKAGMLALMSICYILDLNFDSLKDKWKEAFEAISPFYKKWTHFDRNLVLKHFIDVVETTINNQKMNFNSSSLKYTYMLILMSIMNRLNETYLIKHQIDKQLTIKLKQLIIRLVQDPRIDHSVNDNYTIRLASANGCVEVVKEILKDSRVDPTVRDNFVIQMASAKGYVEVVKELLKDPRVDPTARDNFAIQRASENGCVEVVKELLKDSRVDPTACDNFAIQMASAKGHVEVVKELLKDSRVDPTACDNSAIRLASANGHVEVVKELLKDSRVDFF